MNQSMKISMLATPLMIVFGLLASGAPATAQSEAQLNDQHSSCSIRTLSGDYGSIAQGVLIGNPGLPQEAYLQHLTSREYHLASPRGFEPLLSP